MERRGGSAVTGTPNALSGLDYIYLRRACELATRGLGSTSPNPAVGAVLALGSQTLGEGYHHIRGAAHAEVEAFEDAAGRGADVRGATLYASLEPCNHAGLTPACTQAVIEAGIARVVVGALDPNPRTAGGGIRALRDAGIAVDVASDVWARDLIEDFRMSVVSKRPYVRLKLAASLDGYVAARSGERHWLTGDEAREYVRELRARYDAVAVGAGTVRVDDPLLTVRPARARRKPYRRVVVCETAPVPLERAVFVPVEGYAKTTVLAPAGLRHAFAMLEDVADVVYVGPSDAATLDLRLAFEALRERDIASVLCEGGPTLAARLLAAGLVDRIDWLIAPTLLGGPEAVAALTGGPGATQLRFERIEPLGNDVLVSARVAREE